MEYYDILEVLNCNTLERLSLSLSLSLSLYVDVCDMLMIKC